MLACFVGCYVASTVLSKPKPASVDSCAEIMLEYTFSGVTNSGRVNWRKVPESDDRNVAPSLT